MPLGISHSWHTLTDVFTRDLAVCHFIFFTKYFCRVVMIARMIFSRLMHKIIFEMYFREMYFRFIIHSSPRQTFSCSFLASFWNSSTVNFVRARRDVCFFPSTDTYVYIEIFVDILKHLHCLVSFKTSVCHTRTIRGNYLKIVLGKQKSLLPITFVFISTFILRAQLDLLII